MAPDHGRTAADGDAVPAFVCPLCGTTFESDRPACARCGGTLVVPVDDRTVYETVLPMCGRPDGVERRTEARGDDAEECDDSTDHPLLSSIRPLARRVVAWRP